MGYKTNSLGLHGHFISDVEGHVPVRDSEVLNPSDMMAIGDSFTGGVCFSRGMWGEAVEQYGFASSRHQGKANVAFCDGHVESPKLKFVFEDTNDEALVRWNRDHQPHRDKL